MLGAWPFKSVPHSNCTRRGDCTSCGRFHITLLHLSACLLVDMRITSMTGNREGLWVLCTLCWTSRSLGLHAASLVPQPHLATEPMHTKILHGTSTQLSTWQLGIEPHLDGLAGAI